MNNTISCTLVDDDEIDRLTTLSFLKDYPDIEIKGVFNSPVLALAAASLEAPEVLLLDIDMPEMNGLELRKQLLHIPACVFITSYPDYALEGFEMAALDFLVKPFNRERFAKMIERLRQHASIHKRAALLEHTLGADTIFIKEGTEQVKLNLHDIIYLEALKDYTGIITAKRKYAVLSPLGSLIKEKPFISFIRIHRSYAIQKHFVKKISATEVTVHDAVLPVGRSFKQALKGIKN